MASLSCTLVCLIISAATVASRYVSDPHRSTENKLADLTALIQDILQTNSNGASKHTEYINDLTGFNNQAVLNNDHKLKKFGPPGKSAPAQDDESDFLSDLICKLGGRCGCSGTRCGCSGTRCGCSGSKCSRTDDDRSDDNDYRHFDFTVDSHHNDNDHRAANDDYDSNLANILDDIENSLVEIGKNQANDDNAIPLRLTCTLNRCDIVRDDNSVGDAINLNEYLNDNHNNQVKYEHRANDGDNQLNVDHVHNTLEDAILKNSKIYNLNDDLDAIVIDIHDLDDKNSHDNMFLANVKNDLNGPNARDSHKHSHRGHVHSSNKWSDNKLLKVVLNYLGNMFNNPVKVHDRSDATKFVAKNLFDELSDDVHSNAASHKHGSLIKVKGNSLSKLSRRRRQAPDTEKYGLPFEMDLLGLGQVNP